MKFSHGYEEIRARDKSVGYRRALLCGPALGRNQGDSFQLSVEQGTNWFRGRTSRAFEDADKLVSAVMRRLAEGFANKRSCLEKQWTEEATTFPLRICGLLYSAIIFFDRLLKL
jgi:hypothetical protein